MARRALGPATLTIVQAVNALPDAPWVVGCSGGADSLALAWAAHHIAARRTTPVRAIVVDHGLQAGSDAVAVAVVDALAEFGLAATVVRAHVRDTGGGLEASARDARHAALTAGLADGERILLGHTRDDQAETVLLGLARGSGVRSLAGMAPTRGVLARPLLDVTRATTTQACTELGLRPWRDPMNADHRFARVRAREAVLPVLERELGPGVRDALARTARLAREASDALGVLADTDDELTTDCRYLAGLAPGIRRRILLDWMTRAGASDLAATHVDAVDRLVTAWRGQRGVDVPGGRIARRDGRLVFDVSRLR